MFRFISLLFVVFTFVSTILMSDYLYAATITLIDDNHDSLTPGTLVPGLVPNHPGLDASVPEVQNTNFSALLMVQLCKMILE